MRRNASTLLRASICLALLGLVLCVTIGACDPKEPVAVGASCSSLGKTEACAVGKAVLCSGGTWHEWASCRGPTGCTRYNVGHGSTAINCDGAQARAGGICPPRFHGMVRCSEDGLARLVCQAGAWKLQGACAGGCSEKRSGKEIYLSCIVSTSPGAPPVELKIQ
ncbi:MAG: hypothetical protein JWP87_5879 [Labilithrix sp.]|nr:hypothetical protein [Labilithrix sp.]